MDNLNQWMAVNRINAAKVAQRLGVSRAAVSRWINGKTMPSLAVAVKLERLSVGMVPASCWVGGEADVTR